MTEQIIDWKQREIEKTRKAIELNQLKGIHAFGYEQYIQSLKIEQIEEAKKISSPETEEEKINKIKKLNGRRSKNGISTRTKTATTETQKRK